MADVTLDLPLIPSGFGSYYGTLTTEEKYVDLPAPVGTGTLGGPEIVDESILFFPIQPSTYQAYRPTVQLGEGGGPPEPKYVDFPAPVGTGVLGAPDVLALYSVDLPVPVGTGAVGPPLVIAWTTTDMLPSARETRGVWPDTQAGFADIVSNAKMTWGRWVDIGVSGYDVERLVVNIELERATVDVEHQRQTISIEQGGR